MALADLIKKGISADVATATAATVATPGGIPGETVAKVAGVAVAGLPSSELAGARLGPAAYRTATGETAENGPAELLGKRPEFVGEKTSEKQILLAFANSAGGEKPANADFAKSCKYLILGVRRPGRCKILRPFSVYEYRLAAEVGRRAVFCENHRRELGGTCKHFDIIERLAPGDPAVALDSCLLWQKVRAGLKVEGF